MPCSPSRMRNGPYAVIPTVGTTAAGGGYDMAERLKEQLGYNQQGVFMQRRRGAAGATPSSTGVPASRHYAGHDAGIHGEDAPYTTGVRHRRPPPQEDEGEN